MTHPVGLPHVFVDRSLGRIAVPRLLRGAGIQLTTLAEYYGIPQDEDIADVTWLADTARPGVGGLHERRTHPAPSRRAAGCP
ncbi:hypothetical protein FRACA_1440014 [Frankia canadensis]|uniref:VapC45 PIN like domain-containing protein n=1 Tax=Frankia canadensis TaxID=1836972 RepID=A0A2I2KLL4_9ACTN|nr:hypothetical protein FRACA_1440014 [Frankia canadensis]SOU53840.1 hypothetical protein FRACA_1440014 [Frankia canadensis]